MYFGKNVLLNMRQMIKLYDSFLDEIRKKYHLTQIEVTIISFLYNNPSKDTAKDISALRMLPKGNVSQGVESLIQKHFLTRSPDRTDRRIIHLSLLEEAQPLITEIEDAKIHFRNILFDGFTQEEITLFEALNDRMINNVLHITERKEVTKHEE